MSKDTNISIIQLIKNGKISVNLEISNIEAQKNVNIYVRQYLNRSPDYLEIKQQIDLSKKYLQNAKGKEKETLTSKLDHLLKVEKDFIINALLLAELFSKVEARTVRLKEAFQLFEEGKIKAADKKLPADDLINDQFHLITYVEYKEAKLKLLENNL